MDEIIFLIADYNDQGTPLITPDLATAWHFLLEGKEVFTGTAQPGEPIVLGDWRRLYLAADETAVPGSHACFVRK